MGFKRKNIITYVTIFLVFIAFVIAVIQSFDSNGGKKGGPLLVENDEPISPASDNIGKTDKNILEDKSSYCSFVIEKFYTGWASVLDIVSFNRLLFPQDSIKKFNEYENIRSKILFKKMNFTYGNSNELVEIYGDVIKEQCTHYKLDWRLILAMIRQESYFNPEAVSRAGAYGLMQIMPGTGLGLQNELKLEDTKTPYNNLTAGMYYYATLAASFEFTGEEKYKFALAAYNAGLNRVVDAMTITNYFGKDYTKWDNVKEYYPYLAASQDSVHKLVWPKTGRPPGGTLNNWQEPYKYVEYIIFYYENYKKIYPGNLPEGKPKKTKKKKK
ncbi:MAG: transglycosylase SLT domain-containing protein [Ignavibacteria bacterium]|nr:transglycosylase SLT domain-containing protein [Ignavibacteria bacterium]